MCSIGDRLRAERERLGFNQEDFGQLGGVNRNSQANYEKSKRSPDSDYLSAIAQHGADIAFIVTGTRTPVPEGSLSDGERAVLEHYRQLPDADRAAVQRLTTALAETAAVYGVTKGG